MNARGPLPVTAPLLSRLSSPLPAPLSSPSSSSSSPVPGDGIDAPGRSCPLRYRYGAAAIARAPQRAADVLYVVGGLYGNLAALDALDALVAAEAQPPRICFNGDFHWFDCDDAAFDEVCRRVLAHDATQGNVEAELDGGTDDAGCGCAYPAHVDAGVVARSNRIHARLKATAARHPLWRARLAALPMFARYRVGGCQVGVVHGDAHSLAGWDFDAPALADAAMQPALRAAFATAGVDLFASTHTCTPALHRVRDVAGAAGDAGRDGWVVNNGAAGMPNFAPFARDGATDGTEDGRRDGREDCARDDARDGSASGARSGWHGRHDLPDLHGARSPNTSNGPNAPNRPDDLYGLVTRIATTPSPHPAVHQFMHVGAHVALLPLRYDSAGWQADFLRQWPPGSDAWASYFDRISCGTALTRAQMVAGADTSSRVA